MHLVPHHDVRAAASGWLNSRAFASPNRSTARACVRAPLHRYLSTSLVLSAATILLPPFTASSSLAHLKGGNMVQSSWSSDFFGLECNLEPRNTSTPHTFAQRTIPDSTRNLPCRDFSEASPRQQLKSLDWNWNWTLNVTSSTLVRPIGRGVFNVISGAWGRNDSTQLDSLENGFSAQH